MKKLVILGSTGNVGGQVLDVVDKYPKKLSIVGLAANNNFELLLGQIKKYKPKAVAIPNEEEAEKMRKKVKIPVYSGENALVALTNVKGYDTLINSVVSLFGIRATLNAIRQKKDIALANKETLVAAGSIVMKAVKKYKVKLMPIDSEHSALFQCLNGEKRSEVERLIITCSGAMEHIKEKGYRINNVGISVEAKTPKILPMAEKIRETLAPILEISNENIGINATSGEEMTPFGKGEGVQAFAIVSLIK